MRNLILIITMVFALVIPIKEAVAQENTEQTTPDLNNIDITRLSSTELANYQKLLKKASEMEEQSKTAVGSIRQIATKDNLEVAKGWGKQLGVAFKGCWGEVTDDIERFANSDAGKISMLIIAVKLVSTEFMDFYNLTVQYVFAFTIVVIFVPVWGFLFYRNCSVRRVCIKKSGENFLPWKNSKEYEVVDSRSSGGMTIYFVSIGIIVLLAFILVL